MSYLVSIWVLCSAFCELLSDDSVYLEMREVNFSYWEDLPRA